MVNLMMMRYDIHVCVYVCMGLWCMYSLVTIMQNWFFYPKGFNESGKIVSFGHKTWA